MKKKWNKGIIWILILWGYSGTLNGQDHGFAPFDKAFQGLQEISYIKTATQRESHKALSIKISSNQAIKVIKSASREPGFEYSPRVQEFLDYYTSPINRQAVEIMLGLSESYLTLFSKDIEEMEMPADLQYLPMALSSLNPKAVSVWGATGLWQIMYTQGKLYHLTIDSYIDERRDPVLSTKSALAYLKDLYNIYLDWDLAIAAYTSSPSSVNKAIRKAGGSKKYADLYPFLPISTRDYLHAYTACYILMNQYEQAGFIPYTIEIPNFTTKTAVEKRIHLGQVAEVLHLSDSLLMDMNPEYKSAIIPAVGRICYIKLPLTSIDSFKTLFDSISSYQDTLYFPQTKQRHVETALPPASTVAVVEQNTPTTGNTNTAPPSNKTKLSYTVKDGDNLGYISGWYDVSIRDIKQWNNLSRDVIKVGQELVIWVPDSKVNLYKDIDSKTFSQKQTTPSTASSTTTSSGKSKAKTSSGGSSYTWYTVRSGDNPSTIAARYPGVSSDDILKINNISDPRKLQVGQRIKIPKK